MASKPSRNGSVEAAILERVLRPEEDELPNEAAQALLRLRLDRKDLDRLHELTIKNQDDALTLAEQAELESYLRISSFLDLMHAKARRSLRNHG